MLAVPLLLDLTVVALVVYIVRSRGRGSGARGAAGGTACAVALLAPMCAVALDAPQWIRATAVMMMVLGFYALAEVVGTPTGNPSPAARASRPGREPEAKRLCPPADAADRERMWSRFERQFAAYVESGAGGHGDTA